MIFKLGFGSSEEAVVHDYIRLLLPAHCHQVASPPGFVAVKPEGAVVPPENIDRDRCMHEAVRGNRKKKGDPQAALFH